MKPPQDFLPYFRLIEEFKAWDWFWRPGLLMLQKQEPLHSNSHYSCKHWLPWLGSVNLKFHHSLRIPWSSGVSYPVANTKETLSLIKWKVRTISQRCFLTSKYVPYSHMNEHPHHPHKMIISFIHTHTYEPKCFIKIYANSRYGISNPVDRTVNINSLQSLLYFSIHSANTY